jgi:hypothetical protein
VGCRSGKKRKVHFEEPPGSSEEQEDGEGEDSEGLEDEEEGAGFEEGEDGELEALEEDELVEFRDGRVHIRERQG